jgi:predicted DNA-binding transcriptional regulator AlpA
MEVAVTAREIQRGVTLAAIRSWPAAVNVEQAATAVGISRASAYQAIAEGTFPAKTVKVGRRIKVLTASLLEVLEGGGDRAASA